MRLSADIDVPDPLLAALQKGELVFFVGAGASFDPPSGIPLFNGLAEVLAGIAQVHYDCPARIDEYLGRLDRQLDVRRQIADIVTDASSQPNALHRSLVRLASTHGMPAIITTNFDNHLSKAAEEQSLSVGPIHIGPALPNGRAFQGLVHLHGAAVENPADLVVTDRDFGLAYLTDAWATRFLQDVFSNRTVLFIGYSHNDVVMDYLAMGLSSETARYALVEESDAHRWARLGVETVAYPSGRHDSIVELFDRWADFATAQPLDIHAHVTDLVINSTPENIGTLDDAYLKWAIATPVGAFGFAQAATDPKWLTWLHTYPTFRDLFQTSAPLPPAAQWLSNWFAEQFVAKPDRQTIAFDVLRQMGGNLSDHLLLRAAIALRTLATSDSDLVNPWRTIIESRLHTSPGMGSAILRAMPRERSTADRALALLRRSVIPRARLAARSWQWAVPDERGDATPTMPGMELEWSLADRQIRSLWDEVSADLETYSGQLIQIFEQALLDAHYLQFSFDKESSYVSNWRRSAISEHPQNRKQGVEDVLIDGLRDASAAMSGVDLVSIVERWTLASAPSIFRRLGFNLAAANSSFSVEEKADLLLRNDDLFDIETKHEVFELLAEVMASDDLDSIARILARVTSREFVQSKANSDEAEFEKRMFDRETFDRLDWMARNTDDERVQAAFDEMQDSFPDMGRREHPDLDHWGTVGVWGGKLPVPLHDFIVMMDESIPTALSLIVHDYSDLNFDEPTWDGARELIKSTVATRPDLGTGVLSWSEKTAGDRQQDIDSAVFRGWSEAQPETNTLPWVDILDALLARAADPIGSQIRAETLIRFSTLPIADRAPSSTNTAYQVADLMWRDLHDSFENTYDSLVMTALNSWPGKLARFWISEAVALHTAEAPASPATNAITRMLSGGSKASLVLIWFVASELTNWFAIDQEFATSTVGPLLLVSGAVPTPADEAAWDGFLHSRRSIPREFVNAEFFTAIERVRNWSFIRDDDDLSRSYFSWVALSLLREDVPDAVASQVIDAFIVNDDLVGLDKALDRTAWMLDQSEPGQPYNGFAWTERLSAIVRRRANGVPRRLTDVEASAWSDLILHAGSALATMLHEFENIHAPLSERSLVDPMSRITTGIQDSTATELLEHLAKRVKVSPSLDDMALYDLQELTTLLRDNIPADTLREVVNAAMSVGHVEAATWITPSI